ncbi:MAG: hypothetical protein ACTSQR_07355, partial [Promethearchaeota archaeon]
YTNFTYWFLPPGISGGGSSFPSGHATMGWMFLPLLITVKDRKIKDPLRIIVTVLIIGWGRSRSPLFFRCSLFNRCCYNCYDISIY